MAQKFDATELVSSPMRNISVLLPQVLLDAIDKASIRDDPSAPNRSSWMRRAMISALRREVV